MREQLAWYVANCCEVQERPVKVVRDFHSDMRKVLPSVMFGESCVAYEQSYFDRYSGLNNALDNRVYDNQEDAIASANELRTKQVERLKWERSQLDKRIAELESNPLRIRTYRDLIDRGMEMEKARLEKLLPSPTTRGGRE